MTHIVKSKTLIDAHYKYMHVLAMCCMDDKFQGFKIS